MAAIIRVEPMKLHVSGRDYLKAILMLQMRRGMVCSINLVQQIGDSKPTVNRTVSVSGPAKQRAS